VEGVTVDEASIPMEPNGEGAPAARSAPGVVECVCARCRWVLALSIDGQVFPARRAGRRVAGKRRRWHVTVGEELGREDRLTVTCKCGQPYDLEAPTLRRLAAKAARAGQYRATIPHR
jgi:hypothetical protein